MVSNETTVAVRHQDHSGRDSPLTTREFKAIAQLVHDRTGIVLGDSKHDLVHGRLGKRLRVLGFGSFSEYLELLEGPGGEDEQTVLINAITTNLTSFFREPHHFQTLGKVIIPELAASPGQARRLRIWSAGCSSGEEPYTIAMTVRRALPAIDTWNARILATDIDTNMIETCKAGVYNAEKIDAVPPELRRRFVSVMDAGGADGGTVEMSAVLKQMIRFKRLNLLQPWPMQGPFDVIFCRNVVIYFNKDTQRALFSRFADLLQPGGWLFIGHSESLMGVSDRFQYNGQTTYRKLR